MILFIQLELFLMMITHVRAECYLQPKWTYNDTVEFYRNFYLDTLSVEHEKKTYRISNRFELETRFNFKIPCGTMDYDPGSAIVDGTDAPVKAWPWHVLVFNKTGNCGGALIDDQWVLTAAHCVERKDSDYTVKLGTRFKWYKGDYVLRSTTSIVLHDLYDKATLKNDIALVKMSSPVDFTDRVRPACLPVYGQDFSQNDFCFATGFGKQMKKNDNDILQQTRIYVVPFRECAYLWRASSIRLHATDLCAGRVRHLGVMCHGDSGSPMSCRIVNRYFVAGIASLAPRNCTSDFAPDGFLKVTDYIDWILYNIETFRYI